MKRERIRQVVLAIAALFYVGLIYPLCSDLWHSSWLLEMNNNECEPMFLSFYVGLGFFLLLAVRRPSENRPLIAFAAWSSLFHAFVMTVQTVEAFSHGIHRDYKDVVIAAVIGAVLLAVTPKKQGGAPAGSLVEGQGRI